MAPPFVIPSFLRNLESPVDGEERLYAQEVTVIENLSGHEVDELVRGVAHELAEKEVWCIEEQNIFDQVYSLVRGFSFLEPSARGSLVESLCSNFSVLNPSIATLSQASGESSEDAAYMLQQMHSHRNALKIYSYFLHSILVVEEAAEPAPVEKAPAGKRKQTQPRTQTHVPAKWNWDVHRTRIVRLLATALQADLRQLYSMSQPEENLIAFFARAAFSLLENPAYVKEKDLKEALSNIVAACAAKYSYLVPVTSTILNLLHKYEHLPVHLADLVALAEEKYHNSSLPVAVLREIGHINSEDFKRDNAGADNVSAFLVGMAERLPKLMTMNLSIITCHLDGDAYKMRNGIVQVIGTLIIKASKDPSMDAAGDEVARLRSKQGMVDILLERVRDQSAYTRSKVLQTWAILCVESAVSIGHWNLVARVAAGRLEDKGSIVRKSALQLLTTLLQFNPFGPSLRTGPFEATLEQYKEKLREMELANPTPHEEAEAHLADEHDGDGSHRSTEVDGEGTANLEEAGTAPNTQYDHDSSQLQPEPIAPTADFGGLQQTRALVASLESGLQFARCVAGVMDVLKQLLASSSSDDVKHTITLLILAHQFEVDSAEESLRKMLPLVFSQEKSVSEAVEGAFTSLYMKRSPSETALNLLNLTLDASIGDLASIEALVSKFTTKGDISHGTIAALWNYFTFNAPDVTPQKSRGALAILCMAAKSQPRIFSSHLQSVMDIGLGRRAKEDPLLARYACVALQRLSEDDRASLGSGHKIFSILLSLITGPGLPEESWYSAAEQAINAIYTLHPTPEAFSSSLLLKFSRSVFGFSSRKGDVSSSVEEETIETDLSKSPARVDTDGHQPMASPLSRFLFALAHIALKHLVYVETCVRKLRKQRADKEKAAADVAADLQADAGGSSSQQASNKAKVESINAELGLAASEDARIDMLLERTESEIITGEENRQFLIGAMAPIVAKICRNLGLMQQYPRLRSSAMLALCKLMAIDADFCEQNLQVLFTVAQNSGEAAVRSNCIIALGDLAFRFPNVLEPWTEHMYARLNDKDQRVRKNSVLVLTHLILNDMVKVKGHISEMVLRLEDEDERIQNLVKLFFHELSNKGNNPIYNLLPDILSRLSSQPDLPPDTFRSVMQFLINAITKDKQKEGLFEKLCHRFSGTTDAKQWRDLSYCLAQLSYTDKSLKKMIELFPKYQNALGEEEVVEHFKSVVAKAKKFAKPDVKTLADEFESKILKFHEEKKEHDMAMQNAEAHQKRCHERTDTHSQESGLTDGQDIEQGAEEDNASTAAGATSGFPELNRSTCKKGSNDEGTTIDEEAVKLIPDNKQGQADREYIKNGGNTCRRKKQQSLTESDDEGDFVELAPERSQSADHANGVSRRTSVNTSALLADSATGETSGSETEAGSESGIASEAEVGSARGSDSEAEVATNTRNRQSQKDTSSQHDKPNKLVTRKASLTQNESNTEDYESQELSHTEDYCSQKHISTEDYRSQKYVDTEDFQSQEPPDSENCHSQEASCQPTSAMTGRPKFAKNNKVCSQLPGSDDEQSQEATEYSTETHKSNSTPRLTKVVRRQPVESDDEQSQLSQLSTRTTRVVLKPSLSRKTRKQVKQIREDDDSENSSIDISTRSTQLSDQMIEKSSEPASRRRRSPLEELS